MVAAQDAAARKPENVHVLTGLTLREIRAEMTMMSEALDVKCAHCHVPGNFASDNNRNKVAAREMLRMTKTINAQYFSKAMTTEGTTIGRVTCFTCHRGSRYPVHSPNQLTNMTK
jgi:photosynthetic reaction center cytochrome c subunit